MTYQHVQSLDAVINDTDKVYRNTESGAFVKVRAKRIPNPPRTGFGTVIVEVSGSVCGEDGKALPHGEGHQIAPAQRHTFRSDATVDFARLLELVRLDVAASTERAGATESAASELLPR